MYGEWQGEQVLGIRLTWNKRYITLAPIATVLGLALFKLRDPDHLLSDDENPGITCALIPTDVKRGRNWSSPFPTQCSFYEWSHSRGKDVFVPYRFLLSVVQNGRPRLENAGGMSFSRSWYHTAI